jgi:biopolymer transport protein ExbD
MSTYKCSFFTILLILISISISCSQSGFKTDIKVDLPGLDNNSSLPFTDKDKELMIFTITNSGDIYLDVNIPSLRRSVFNDDNAIGLYHSDLNAQNEPVSNKTDKNNLTNRTIKKINSKEEFKKLISDFRSQLRTYKENAKTDFTVIINQDKNSDFNLLLNLIENFSGTNFPKYSILAVNNSDGKLMTVPLIIPEGFFSKDRVYVAAENGLFLRVDENGEISVARGSGGNEPIDLKTIKTNKKPDKNAEKEENTKDKIYMQFEVDKAPVALNLADVSSSIKYPEDARKSGVEGKISVKIMVGIDGTIESVGGISGPEEFYDEIKSKVVNLKFTPAIKKGKPVRCWVLVPFRFALTNKPKNADTLKSNEYEFNESGLKNLGALIPEFVGNIPEKGEVIDLKNLQERLESEFQKNKNILIALEFSPKMKFQRYIDIIDVINKANIEERYVIMPIEEK